MICGDGVKLINMKNKITLKEKLDSLKLPEGKNYCVDLDELEKLAEIDKQLTPKQILDLLFEKNVISYVVENEG
jgi:hypothetical protein